MGTTSVLRRNNAAELIAGGVALVDLETRATKDDHQALRLWLRLLACTVRVENHVRSGLRQEFATTLPRFDLMAQLERYPGGLRMSELSKRLMVSGGNVTGITDQLEREGFVVRTLDRGDRRAITVKLTPAGLKRFREMAASHEQWIVELLAGLSREEKQTMLGTLSKLKSHLSGVSAPSSSRKPGSVERSK
jgi:DNA-binding MarR family transcriptional regulator